MFTQAAGIRNPRTPGIYNAGYSNLRPDDPTNQGAQVALSPVYIETNDAPPVTNIVVCFGYDDREVNVSWDAVPDATYYRIGYVNMVKDYPRAKTSVTGEWLEAFIYVDVNALNIPVNDEGRANYTLRRLSSGDRRAFTVLTSNNVTVTRKRSAVFTRGRRIRAGRSTWSMIRSSIAPVRARVHQRVAHG